MIDKKDHGYVNVKISLKDLKGTGIVREGYEIPDSEYRVSTDFVEIDVIKEHNKDVDGEESNKVSFDDVYKNENKDDVELHVKDVQNSSLDTYKLVVDLRHQNIIQILCEVRSPNF